MPRGLSADEGGTTREADFDPLDPVDRAARERAGLRVYATVLQPGETIVAPDCWWHYAVSLTPTITIMDNFWDAKNYAGLRELIRGSATPVPPDEPLAPTPVSFTAAGQGVAGTAAFVIIRAQPSADAPVLGVLRAGEVRSFDVSRQTAEGLWRRTAQPVAV